MALSNPGRHDLLTEKYGLSPSDAIKVISWWQLQRGLFGRPLPNNKGELDSRYKAYRQEVEWNAVAPLSVANLADGFMGITEIDDAAAQTQETQQATDQGTAVRETGTHSLAEGSAGDDA